MENETFKKIYNATLTSVRYATLSKLVDDGDDADIAEDAYLKAINDLANAILDLINKPSNDDGWTRTADYGGSNL